MADPERVVGAFSPGFHPWLLTVFPFGEFRNAEKVY